MFDKMLLNGVWCWPSPKPTFHAIARLPEGDLTHTPLPTKKRRRIPEDVKNEIHYTANDRMIGINELAKIYGVNKNTIIRLRDTWVPTEERRFF